MRDRLDPRSPDYWVISDISGRKFPRSECRFTWNGLLVHSSEWEPRQPQDTIQTPVENPSVPDARPRGPVRYVTVTPEDL